MQSNNENSIFKAIFESNSYKDLIKNTNLSEVVKTIEDDLGEHKEDFLRIAELIQSKDTQNIQFNIQSAMLESVKQLLDFQEKAYHKLDDVYRKIPNQDNSIKKAVVIDLKEPFQIISTGKIINKLYVLPLLVMHIKDFSDVISHYQNTNNYSNTGNAGQDKLFERVCRMYAEAQLITDGDGYYLQANDFDLMDITDYTFFLTLCLNGGNNWVFSNLKQLEKQKNTNITT